ncbi:hypothetical protein EAX61_10620 [Dokdonia sinensis]|uniref:YfhO family protein n=1 Tax=Dokdonia sinensis TaxID=2479847 RepID=A0A3M0FYK5_9FLAO|nr:YfhO family protein [Dokdonia sinensis]RMB57568.1 hypothetical protein EAX61_10620 [Dokdonia sinensis]
MPTSLKQLLPHILVIFGFIAVSLLFFNPVLSGKMLYQNDIKQYEGMAQQHRQFRAETGEETYWTNGAFGGMPTYQMGAYFPHDYMDKLDRAIRFLPRPADYLFLYFFSFYILMLVMRVPWKLGVLGALAFGFSAYLIIIIGVGHNSKAHAIGYFPLVLAGIIMTFQKRYLWGFLLTAVAMGLEIQANHYQMTYYLGFLVLILGIAYLVDAFKRKQLPHFFKAVGILVLAVLLGLATNATTLLSTAEYAKASIRGEKLLTPENPTESTTTDGLDFETITQWSYGITESFNLFIPKLFGSGRASDLGRDSAFYKKLINLQVPSEEANYYAQTTSLYWGDQPFVEDPPYIGVTVVLLGLLGLFLIKGRLRWWLIGGIVFSLVLSWGKNFEGVSRFFVDYVPLYNKFRAITSIQVILELLFPIAAVIGLHQFYNQREDSAVKTKKLFIAVGILGGLCLVFFLFGGSLFDLRSDAEGRMAIEQPEILNSIKADRLTILKSDSLRSLLLVLTLGGILWLSLKAKIKENIGIVLIGCIILFDLVGVDRRSVTEENFITERKYAQNFEPTPADKKILEDDGYFRVLDQYRGYNQSHAAYFFNSLNGYSAVRPQRMEDVYNLIASGNVGALNMLNVKYIIQDNKGAMYTQRNPYANGPAWFVNDIQYVPDYNAEYNALREINTKETVVIREKYKNEIGAQQLTKDSTAIIKVIKSEPNELVYESNNSKEGFAVFAEAYYEHGWKATIDGNPTEIYPVNYMLRGIKVPAGNHTIAFVFDPQVVKTGSTITLASSLLLVILVLGGLFYTWKESKKEEAA